MVSDRSGSSVNEALNANEMVGLLKVAAPGEARKKVLDASVEGGTPEHRRLGVSSALLRTPGHAGLK